MCGHGEGGGVRASSGVMTQPRSLSAWMRQLGSIGEVHAWPGQGHDGACT